MSSYSDIHHVAFRLVALSLILVGLVIGSMVNSPVAAAEPAVNRPSFDEEIAPLLARRCLGCHNPSDLKGELDLTTAEGAATGGASGAVLDPKIPEESLLWQYVRDENMPPENPLPEKEKRLLLAWITSGAKWGSGPIDRFRYSTDQRAGKDWWALQPVVRPDLPEVRDPSWPVNAIDYFVLARLEAAGLSPAPRARPRTLLRRLSFDLLGLPPELEAIQQFQQDVARRYGAGENARANSPDSAPVNVSESDPDNAGDNAAASDSPQADRAEDPYSALVDAMLASPHYGERWGRHWLDIVRFGESNGFEYDKMRPHAWPYRDWVIRALNNNLPYDEFARWQIAGDVLHPENADAVIATGFLVAGPYDRAGQNQQSAAMRAVVRQDELEDILGTLGQTFLGLTINCARCHDHKFDPVTQREYYQLTAALAGVRHGERSIETPESKSSRTALSARVQEDVQALTRRISSVERDVRETILARRKSLPKVEAPEPLARWDFRVDLRDSLGSLHGAIHGSATRDEQGLHLDGKDAYVSTEAIEAPLRAKTLETWVQLDTFDQRGGGVISLQSLDGVTFDAIVFGEQEPRHWLAGSNNFARTKTFSAPEENDARQRFVHLAITYAKDGTITAYRDGQPYGTAYKSSGIARFEEGQSQLLFGLRHAPAGGNRLLRGTIQRAALYDRALNAEEVAASAGTSSNHISEQELTAQLDPASRELRKHLLYERRHLESQFERIAASKTYAVVPKKPEPTHLLARGNPASPTDLVAAGGIAALTGVVPDFDLKPDADEAPRRIRLARWMTDARNPLFARVIVNRMWHHHFGEGLVDTPNDFGFNGGRPSHPLLIDYLASQLIQSGWDLKTLHREIVHSATYRQSGRFDEKAAAIDTGNRLLWRRSPQRLEAEVVRDAILQVAGHLNRQQGGPSFFDFLPFERSGTQTYVRLDPVGAAFDRRSVYRMWARSGRNPFLDAFDCPDPSTTTPRRAVTNTPLQALTLMNNRFVLRMADDMAEQITQQITQQSGEATKAQVQRVYELAYARSAQQEELDAACRLVEDHGLAALCRVVFNSNEFLYVD
jgi:hypothetical protein